MGSVTDREVPKSYWVEWELPVGRDEVWAAVTQPEVLRQWFGWDYDGLGDEIQHIFVNEAVLRSPERMGWADGSYLEVTGDDGAAWVRAVRDGDSGAPDRFDAIEEGWRAFLVQLRHLLVERPRGERRTLYMTGASTWPQVLAMLDLEVSPDLGDDLGSVSHRSSGSHGRNDLSGSGSHSGNDLSGSGSHSGNDLSGSGGHGTPGNDSANELESSASGTGAGKAQGGAGVAHRSGDRVLWLVNEDGHLIVASGREPVGSKFAGRMEVTVSTYGLDDGAFDLVRKRWTERWSPVARNARVTTAETPAP
jgi:hypothetical protein